MKLTTKIGLLVIFASAFSSAVFAQLTHERLPKCGDDLSFLTQEIRLTGDHDILLRAVAAAGRPLMPALRTLSKPGQPSSTVAGAAQVALARLGDEQSLNELKEEIRGKPSKSVVQGMQKLAMVRTDAALSLIMHYLINNKVESKRVIDQGDVVEDPLLPALKGAIAMFEDPPYTRADIDIAMPSHLDGWESWWRSTKPPCVTPIAEELKDPQARCFARFAEWEYPEGVSELYAYSGRNSIAALQHFVRLGDKGWETSAMGTVRGLAQTVLAREGNKEQFQRIVRELNGPSYSDAVKKLSYIGGRDAFEALLSALSLNSFIQNMQNLYGTRPDIAVEGQKLRTLVMAVLPTMVKNPPLTTTAERSAANIQKWQDWWAKNRESAEFLSLHPR